MHTHTHTASGPVRKGAPRPTPPSRVSKHARHTNAGILNDFGATRYYFYLTALLGFLLLRVARALIATPLPTLLQQASVRVTGSRPVPLSGPGPGFRNGTCSGGAAASGCGAQGGGGADGLGALMAGAVHSVASRLQVNRTAAPGAAALLQDPDQLIRSVARVRKLSIGRGLVGERMIQKDDGQEPRGTPPGSRPSTAARLQRSARTLLERVRGA